MSEAPLRIRWAPILLEAFFVVLGVVLALGANEWRQHRAATQRAATALDAIEREILENRAAVARALDYHLMLSDSLRAFERRNGPEAEAPMTLFPRGFFSPGSVFSTAWEAAQTTDATAQMPYERVVLLSRTYEEQAHYGAQAQTIGSQIYAELFTGGLPSLQRRYRNLAAVVRAVWYTECRLLVRYDSTLDGLGSEAQPERPAACAYTTER